MYVYVLHIVDVLLLKDHHQMLAKKITIIIRIKILIFYFTRRRINSSGRKSFDDAFENIFVDDEGVITKGSRKIFL